MAKKKTLSERLWSMALELRGHLPLMDESLGATGTDSPEADVRRDLEILVWDMEALATRVNVAGVAGPVTPGTCEALTGVNDLRR
jgi:hypothetical protein